MNELPPAPASCSSPRLTAVDVCAVVLAACAVWWVPRSDMNDDTVRFKDMSRVLSGFGTEEKFSMVGPLCATPLYLLGRALGGDEEIEIAVKGEVRIRHAAAVKRCVWYFNRVVLLVACAGFWWLLRPVLSAPERARFVVALVLTSMVPHHLMFFAGEVFTCATAALGLAAVVLRRAWWGVPLAVLGTVNVPGTLGALGLAAAVLVARTRRLRFLLAAPAALGLYLLENYLRRGDPWFTGYDGESGARTVLPYSGQPEFSYPLFFGLLSVLFSFGKGLVFFVPLLFLPLPADPDRPADPEERLRWVYRVWVGYVAGLVLVYARWWSWSGGWFWGPRFFLFGCVVAALVAARRTAGAARAGAGANLLTLGALALAAWGAVCGVVYGQEGLVRYIGEGYATEFVVWYVPECSALWWPCVDGAPPRPGDWVWIALVGAGLCYLAAPVAAALAPPARALAARAWRAVVTGPVRV